MKWKKKFNAVFTILFIFSVLLGGFLTWQADPGLLFAFGHVLLMGAASIAFCK